MFLWRQAQPDTRRNHLRRIGRGPRIENENPDSSSEVVAMLKSYVAHILESIARQKQELQRQWATTKPVRHLVIDGVLPDDEVERIDVAFPPVTEMRLLNSLRERKYTSKNMDSIDSRCCICFSRSEGHRIAQ